MNKFWTILSHTYMTRFKSKPFIVTTIIALIFIIGMTNIQSVISMFKSDDVETYAIIDHSNELYPTLEESMSQFKDQIKVIPYDKSEATGKDAVQEGDFDALIVMNTDDDGLPKVTYYADTVNFSVNQMTIVQQLDQLKIAIVSQQESISQEVLNKINEPIHIEKVALSETAKTDEELNQARGIVYIMLFVLYMAVIVYGQMIATDVATEKSSRVMEILISSASPVTHMFAKIVGIALLGLTQIGVFVAVGFGLIQSKQSTYSSDMLEVFGFEGISISLYFYAILFFFLGYFLYATIAAMLGSLVSRVEDVQHLLIPMFMLIMIAFFIAIYGTAAPTSKLITITSYIPFFTPMIMFLRVGMLDVPIWEVLLSIGLLIVTIIILGIIGARVYRGGVLMYGPSRTLKDLKKAFTLSKRS